MRPLLGAAASESPFCILRATNDTYPLESRSNQPTIRTASMKISTIATFSLAVLLAAVDAAITAPYYDEDLGCWAISVEHDATYCIDGPICSGSGATPAGTLCPVKGNVAIADCHSYLESYGSGDSCVLPVDATCQVIKTGAWGCVLSGSTTPAPTSTCGGDCEETPAPTPCATKTTTPKPTSTTTPYPTITSVPNPTKTAAPTSTPCPGCTAAPTKTPCPGCTAAPTTTPHPPKPTPTPVCRFNCTSGSGSFPGNGSYVDDQTILMLDATETSSSAGLSAGVIGAIAAAAAIVAVVVAAAIYKQHTKKLSEEEALEEFRVSVVTP